MRTPLLLLLLFPVLLLSCKKDPPQPPKLSFKSGTGFVSSDVTVSAGDTLFVGVLADRTERDLKVFYVDYAYDGTSLGTLYSRTYIGAGENVHYENIVQIVTRSTPGNERWIFNVSDDDGNTVTKEIKIRTQ